MVACTDMMWKLVVRPARLCTQVHTGSEDIIRPVFVNTANASSATQVQLSEVCLVNAADSTTQRTSLELAEEHAVCSHCSRLTACGAVTMGEQIIIQVC